MSKLLIILLSVTVGWALIYFLTGGKEDDV